MAFTGSPKKNTEYIFIGVLADTSDATTAKASATIAAGDFQVSTDGGAFANLATLPAVTPAGGVAIKITLSTDETNGDYIIVRAADQTGPSEWNENHWVLTTTTNDVDDVKTDTAAILIDTTGLDGDAMRGTDSAALATALTTHDGKLDTVSTNVDSVLVDTTGLNGDAMRGTDSAALATALATHDGKIDTVSTNVDSILVDTTGLNGDVMRGTDSAATAAALTTHDTALTTHNTVLTTHDTALGVVDTNVDTIEASVAKIEGLVLRNIFQHTMTFDSGGNLLSGTLDHYNSKANADTHDGSTGLLNSYTITATYSGDNLSTLLHTDEA